MTVHTSATSKIYISNNVSTADTTLEFQGETYVELGEVVSIGEFGSEFNPITFTALSDRLVRKFKGSEDPGTVAVEIGFDSGDAGQDLLRTALASDEDYAFKVTLNDAGTGSPSSPTTFYFRAKVMMVNTGIGNADQVTMGNASLGITTRPIMIAAV